MPGIDWSDLRIFLAIHRGHSIRAAAKSLDLSHSTVSRRLVSMENDLGAKLFGRTADGLVANLVAETILSHAERVETEILSLEREVQGRDIRLAGPVRITVAPPVSQHLIMPHLAEFAAQYPDIELEIISTYALADMSRQHADIAVRFQEEPDENLFGRRWQVFADCVYATQDYIDTHTFTGATPTAHWLGWTEGDKQPAWVKESPFPNCGVRHIVPDPMAQIAAIKAGMGIGMLGCFLADREPDLVRVPGVDVGKGRQAWVLTHPDLKTTERVRVCVRFLFDAVAKHTDLISGRLR
jgi:DNA-binding transcriptional LysR family regulator